MAKKTGFKKFIISLVTVILSVALLIGLAGLAVYNFVIIPKYNNLITNGEKTGEKLSNKDLVMFAKYLTDKQLITNLVNLDKESAKDVLSIMLELEAEMQEEAEDITQTPIPQKPSVFTQMEKVPMPTPAPTPFVAPEIPEEVEVPKEQQSAYDKIMAAAKKEEISRGLSIISKVDMEIVMTYLQRRNYSLLKRYLASVLTPKEVSDSMALYRKYRHLL